MICLMVDKIVCIYYDLDILWEKDKDEEGHFLPIDMLDNIRLEKKNKPKICNIVLALKSCNSSDKTY